MKIYLGTDHAGFALKEAMKAYLQVAGFEIEDLGAHAFTPGDDYFDFIVPVAKRVAAEAGARGIVFGGSGQGEAMAANRVRGVRAFVYYAPGKALGALDAAGTPGRDGLDIVRLARKHNDSNVLSLGARFVSTQEAQSVIDAWLQTAFEGGHHEKRKRLLDEVDA